MNCPKCNGIFETKLIGDIQVDSCTQCAGLWFEAGELSQARADLDRDVRWLDVDLFKDAELVTITKNETRLCPVNRTPLASVHYGPTQVVVDVCPDCRGIFMESGEFEKILSELSNYVATLPEGELEHAAIKQAKEWIKGDKSRSAEWKDLKTVLRLLQYRVLIEHPKVRETLLSLQSGLPTQYW